MYLFRYPKKIPHKFQAGLSCSGLSTSFITRNMLPTLFPRQFALFRLLGLEVGDKLLELRVGHKYYLNSEWGKNTWTQSGRQVTCTECGGQAIWTQRVGDKFLGMKSGREFTCTQWRGQVAWTDWAWRRFCGGNRASTQCLSLCSTVDEQCRCVWDFWQPRYGCNYGRVRRRRVCRRLGVASGRASLHVRSARLCIACVREGKRAPFGENASGWRESGV